MEEILDPLEEFWDRLLSRQPARIRQAFGSLDEAEREAVLAHLLKMASEPGWQPEQRESAQSALMALD
jgi:hypothetical protein